MSLHTSSAYLTAAQNTRSLVLFQAIEHLTLHIFSGCQCVWLNITANRAILPSGGVHCPSTIASTWMLAEGTINDAY